jgi:hypothetical protein
MEAIFIHSIAALDEVTLWKKVIPKAQMAKGIIARAQSLFSRALGFLRTI